MASNPVDRVSPTLDNRDEYPHVTQVDPDRAQFRIGVKPVSDEDEIERVKPGQSKVLKAILDDAEARIQATGGIRNDIFWNQLDAEYQNMEDSD
jgi:hypothetical protein